MNKKQKIWLWIFLAMFVLPELLWSPIVNLIYSIITPTINGSFQVFRNNFLLNSNFDFLFLPVLLVQFVGILIFTINWVRVKNNIQNKIIYRLVLILSILLSILSAIVFFVGYSVSNISFP